MDLLYIFSSAGTKCQRRNILPMSLSLKVTILICIFLPEGQVTLLLRAQGQSAFSFLFRYLLTEAFKGPASQACYGGRNGTWLRSRYLWDVTEGRTGGRTGQRGVSQQGWVPPRSLPFPRPAPDRLFLSSLPAPSDGKGGLSSAAQPWMCSHWKVLFLPLLCALHRVW